MSEWIYVIFIFNFKINILNLFSISTHLWTNIILDFIIKLLQSNDYNAILIVIDWLINKKYYIPYTTDKNGIIAETLAYLLLNTF